LRAEGWGEGVWRGRRLLVLTLLAVGYSAAAAAGHATRIPPSDISAIWPPDGLALSVLLLCKPAAWPWIVGTVFASSLVSNLVLGQLPQPSAVTGVAAVDALTPLLAALLLRRYLADRPRMNRLRDVVALAVLAGGAASALGALAGALIAAWSYGAPFASAWRIWWISGSLGMLVVTPTVLSFHELFRSGWLRLRRWRAWEGLTLLGLLLVVGRLVFSARPEDNVFLSSMPYLLFPLLFWAATRFGPWGAALGSLLASTIAVSFTVLGTGPFAFPASPIETRVLAVQLFLFSGCLFALMLAAVMEERREVAGRLQESREELRTLLDSLGDGVVAVASDGNLLAVNRQAALIAGRNDSEMVGRSLDEVLPLARGPGRERVPWPLDAIVGRGERIDLPDDSLLLVPGNPHPAIAARGAPLRTPEGGVRGAVIVFRDVTEQLQLQEQLRLAQRMESVGRLAGGIAHDFNNILTIILGNCELLLAEMDSETPVAAGIRQIQSAGDKAAELTRQLLAFSRKQLVQASVVEVNQLVSAAEPMLRRLLGEDIVLKTELSESSLYVETDSGQLEQILLNLCVNARDAMPTGGTLTIRTTGVARPSGDIAPSSARAYACLAVCDTGHGMGPEVQAHIFEPFFTTKPVGKGTGLGLATVYAIATQWGGEVRVHSEPDRGSTFEVLLPLSLRSEATRKGLVEAHVNTGRETILVVEDEPAVRITVRRHLEALGYPTLEAEGPREGIELLRRHRQEVSLVLTDVVMPEMSGPQMVERMRREVGEIRVLYMTGYTDDETVLRGVSADETALIQKPFSRQELARRVQEVLGSGSR
jgi:hypothetical protein